MMGGEAHRPGVLGDVRDPDRLRVVDQIAKQALAVGKRADLVPLAGGDTGGHELDEVAVLADHTQRAVAGVRHLDGEVDNSLQDDGQRELGGQRKAGFQQRVLTVSRLIHPRESTAGASSRAVRTVGCGPSLADADGGTMGDAT